MWQLGTCKEYSIRRRDSGLDEILEAVTWDHLLRPEDIADKAGLIFCGKNVHIRGVSLSVKDPYIWRLCNAVKSALLHGFTNGLSKVLIWRMVDFFNGQLAV